MKFRYPFFYIFTHSRSSLDILPNFNLLGGRERTFELSQQIVWKMNDTGAKGFVLLCVNYCTTGNCIFENMTSFTPIFNEQL